MHFKYLVALAVALLFVFSQNPTDAQIVRFGAGGGVNVRAPFVRVNVDPFGNTSVRAPFVNINPAYGGRPVYPQPYPTYPNRAAILHRPGPGYSGRHA